MKSSLGGTVTRSMDSSVYMVPSDWVLSRESLAKEESEVIYLKVSPMTNTVGHPVYRPHSQLYELIRSNRHQT